MQSPTTAAASPGPDETELRMLALESAQISYRVSGHGPAVLLIQGVGVPGEGWRPQIDGLRDRFTTVSFDNRGIGRSTILSGPLSIEVMATDALAIMDAQRIDRFHVVGHSMGGLIAQEVALRAIDRVRTLSLLCTFARGSQGARPTPGMMVTAIRTRIGTRAMRRNAFLQLVMPRALLATKDRAKLGDELRQLFGRDLAEQPPIVLKQVAAMGRYNASARLERLAKLPTLVVSAELDRIALPRYGRELAAAIPGARFVLIEGAAHGVPIHAPAVINDLLAGHMKNAAHPE